MGCISGRESEMERNGDNWSSLAREALEVTEEALGPPEGEIEATDDVMGLRLVIGEAGT